MQKNYKIKQLITKHKKRVDFDSKPSNITKNKFITVLLFKQLKLCRN